MKKKATRQLEIVMAAVVHCFTGLGAVVAFFAVLALFEKGAPEVLGFLGLSLLIDTLDGPLARKLRVKEVLPWFDGSILDHVIDYITYALIPALFMYQFHLLPLELTLFGCSWIVFTSLYCFANKQLKTPDNFFSGFPAAWNFVILYFYVFDTDPTWNFGAVIILGLMTYAPIKFIHPIRVRALRSVTLPMLLIWSGLCLYFLHLKNTGVDLWIAVPTALYVFLGVSLYFLLLCLIRTTWGALTENE